MNLSHLNSRTIPFALPPDGTYPVLFENTPAQLTLKNGQATLDPEPEESGVATLLSL